MSRQIASKVPITEATASKCLCPGCPVQSKSECVAGLKATLNETLKKNPLKHDEVPGVYCGSGKATCKDIDTERHCICSDCSIFTQFKLASGKPTDYFCKHGASK